MFVRAIFMRPDYNILCNREGNKINDYSFILIHPIRQSANLHIARTTRKDE